MNSKKGFDCSMICPFGRTSGRISRGFSFVELLLVVALVGVVAAAAYPVITSTMDHYASEAAFELLLSTVRNARQSAIDNRRAYRLTFTAPGSIAVWRQDSGFAWERDRQLNMTENVSFSLPSGIPGIPMIPHSSDIDFGGDNTFLFRGDGSAISTSGQVVSGVVYLSRNDGSGSCWAVSIFGGTGMARGWTYEGEQWN